MAFLYIYVFRCNVCAMCDLCHAEKHSVIIVKFFFQVRLLHVSLQVKVLGDAVKRLLLDVRG